MKFRKTGGSVSLGLLEFIKFRGVIDAFQGIKVGRIDWSIWFLWFGYFIPEKKDDEKKNYNK